MAVAVVACQAAPPSSYDSERSTRMITKTPLSTKQQVIVPVAAFTAIGNLPKLNGALGEALDAGLSISDCKEILVQMYAYAGFPRSINGLNEFMRLLQSRKQQGIADAPGRESGPVPQGAALLETGTANQTKLSGAPVKGPLFDFAPAIDLYLKTHLFGDIFARDNLDWKSRELATVGALAAITGVESQLQAHVRISMNIGLTPAALRDAADALERGGFPDAAKRARAAVEKQLASV